MICTRQSDSTSRGNRWAFSRIELMVSMLVLAVVMSVYLVPFSRGVRRQSKGCEDNLLKLHVALSIYANDHDGRYPMMPEAKTAEEPLDLLVPQYNTDRAIFICPASKDAPLPAGESLRNHRISYAYYMGRGMRDPQMPLLSDAQVDVRSKAVGQSAFSVDGKGVSNNHRNQGGNVLLTDGRVEFIPPQTTISLVFGPGVVLLNPKPKAAFP